MTTTTHDMAALLAAIDAGDDSALLPLADLLDEQGDRRAAGLRLCGTPVYWTHGGSHRWTSSWAWCTPMRSQRLAGMPLESHQLASEMFNRLRGGLGERKAHPVTGGVRNYKTRSAAFLALAEALANA